MYKNVIYFLMVIFVSGASFADPIVINGNRYYFHRGTPERIASLLKSGKLDDKTFMVATSKGRELSVYGRGFYVGAKFQTLPFFSTALTILEVPENSDAAVLAQKDYQYYRFKSGLAQSRFISTEQFIKILFENKVALSSEEFGYFLLHLQHTNLKKIFYTKDFIDHLLGIFDNVSDIQGDKKIAKKILSTAIRDWVLSDSQSNFLLRDYSKSNRAMDMAITASRFIDEKHFVSELVNLAKYPEFSRSFRSVKSGVADVFTSQDVLYSLTFDFDYDSQPERRKILEKSLYVYGLEAGKQWMQSAYLVDLLAQKQMPTLADFKKLHKIVYPKSVGSFKSYENFKKISKYSSSELTEGSPRGLLRNGPIYISSPISAEDQSIEYRNKKYFSEEQILNLINNPYLKIHDIQPTAEGYRARIEIPYSANFEKQIEQLFVQMQQDVTELKRKKMNDDEYEKRAVRLASDFYYELSSRHPFWDGSGRTTKLIRDWFLIYMGVNPPVSSPANDWELSKDEIFQITYKNVLMIKNYYFTKLNLAEVVETLRINNRNLDLFYGSSELPFTNLKVSPSMLMSVCKKIY